MLNKKEVKIPLFYLYIHSILKDKFEGVRNLKEIINFMHEWRIPKIIRTAIEQELENYGLITRLDRKLVKINNSNVLINTTTEMYQYVGILSDSK